VVHGESLTLDPPPALPGPAGLGNLAGVPPSRRARAPAACLDIHRLMPSFNASRRRFVQGLAIGGAAAGLGLWLPATARGAPGARGAGTLEGTRFDLSVGHAPVNYTGRRRLAVTVNGSVPGPLLRWK